MNHLRRAQAPISDAAWDEIDAEASRSLSHFLTARRIVDFTGPLGWDAACVSTGRVEPVERGFTDGVTTTARQVRPLLELRAEFRLARRELDAIERGARDARLDPVVEAGRRIAEAEDRLVFDGHDGILGLAAGSPHEPIEITDDYADFPKLVARAVSTLRSAGVGGPYAVALGPVCHRGVIEETERGGYPVLEHLKLITGGPLVWAPAVDGSVVVSLRGGDYELVCGQDHSVGYLDHDAEAVTLYLEESLTFRNLTPEAAVPLRYPEAAKGRRYRKG